MKAIIKVNNERGRVALLWHKREEDLFRIKARRIPKMFRNKKINIFLKTNSTMYEDRLIITNFEHHTEEDKDLLIKTVNAAMIENGAETKDFEVFFNDGN